VKQSNKNLAKTYREIGPYLGLGTQLAASIIIMFFIGRWLDNEFGLHPTLTIIFSFVGGGAGIYNVIRSTINLNKKKKID
jgi:F0F1-type ATP synthase assembly protein I